MKRSGAAALALILYFAAYMIYLAWRPEGEFLHWVTLVGIPAALLYGIPTVSGHGSSWHEILSGLGLAERPSRRGIVSALIVGAALSGVQLFGRNGGTIRALIQSGRALWLWPLSFALMVATAAGTEELFFRAMLQKRLTAVFRSRVVGIGLATVLFAIYHVPYAYHTAGWGVQYDLGGAIRAAAETGVPLGVLLGAVFSLSGESTIAAILAHGLINALPGMIVVQRLLGG